MPKSILLIEDEVSLLSILKSYFLKEGFTVYTAENGLDGIMLFKDHDIHIVCSDIMMPKVDGFEVAKKIREMSDVPIILLTALDTEEDQIKGYDLQIDEYITKPFSPKILIAKVNAILKRISPKNIKNQDVLEFQGLRINMPAHTVSVDGKRVHLSKTEFDLLVYLAKNINQAISRSDFLDEIWGLDVYVEERVIDTNIKMLRKKIKPYDNFIQTVFKVGYKFEIL